MSEIINAIVPIDKIKAHPQNYNQHPEEQLQQLAKSLESLGQFRSVVIWQQPDGTYVQLAGHGVVEAMKREGATEVRADILPPSLDAMTAKQVMLADNLHAQNSLPDDTALARLLEEQQNAGYDLAVLGTDEETLRQMLESLGDEILTGENVDEDEEENEIENAPARCLSGDLWQLGKHVLLVGDSTKPDDVQRLTQGKRAKLLASDPPYNVGVKYGERVNDGKAIAEYDAFSRAWFTLWRSVSDLQIVTPGYNNLASWCRLFTPYHFAPWTKTNSMTRGHVSLFVCWEPILFFGTGWRRTRTNDVFEFPVGMQKETGNHPCPKPLKLWIDLLENYTEPGDVVADAFGGSGTTLIAAERTGRIARLCEIEPKYADIIAARWEKETGQTAILVERSEEVAAHA